MPVYSCDERCRVVRCAQVRAGLHCEYPSHCPPTAKPWLDTCETPELFTIDVGMSSAYGVRCSHTV